MKSWLFVLILVLVSTCNLAYSIEYSSAWNIHKNVNQNALLIPSIPAKNNFENAKVINSPIPMSIKIESDIEKYISISLEVKEDKYIHYMAHAMDINEYDSHMSIIIPSGPAIKNVLFHQTFIPVSSVGISDIFYNKETEEVSIIIKYAHIVYLFRDIIEQIILPAGKQFEELKYKVPKNIDRKVKIILKKDIFGLGEVEISDNSTCPYNYICESKSSIYPALKVEDNHHLPERIYRSGTNIIIDEAKVTRKCGDNCKVNTVGALYNLSTMGMNFFFYNAAKNLFRNTTKIDQIIGGEFVKNESNAKYVKNKKAQALDDDSCLGYLIPNPLFNSPMLYISKEDASRNIFNLGARSIIPIGLLEKDFTVEIDRSIIKKKGSNKFLAAVSLENLLPTSSLSTYYNARMLTSLLSVVDHLITSMKLQDANWYARQSWQGLTQVIRPGILYALRNDEDYVPLASSLYYYIVNVIYDKRRLHILDPNMVLSVFKIMNSYKGLFSITEKKALEKYIIFSSSFCDVYKRVVLGCQCTPDYSQPASVGSLVNIVTKVEIFRSCWCSHHLIVENLDTNEQTYTLLNGEETEEEKKKKLQKSALASKKVISKPSGFSSTTKSIVSVVAIVVTVVAVVSLVSYYSFFT